MKRLNHLHRTRFTLALGFALAAGTGVSHAAEGQEPTPAAPSASTAASTAATTAATTEATAQVTEASSSTVRRWVAAQGQREQASATRQTLSGPVMRRVHDRYLKSFEQDIPTRVRDTESFGKR